MTAQPGPANPLASIHKPHTVIVNIDPGTARRWLQQNTSNRPIRPDTLGAYMRDMENGQWKLTGESIKFAADGTLLDGQHRLLAIAEGDSTIPMFVTRNLPADAQEAMDSGMKRTASDALQLRGRKNPTISASAARLALNVANEPDRIGKAPCTHAEILQFLDEHPEIDEAVEFASQKARYTDCPPTIVAYTLWSLSRVNREAAWSFWTAAADKVGLSAGDPVIALTNRFADARRNRERLTSPVMLSMVYRAWNTRRDGRTMRFIRVNSPGVAGGIIPIPDPR